MEQTVMHIALEDTGVPMKFHWLLVLGDLASDEVSVFQSRMIEQWTALHMKRVKLSSDANIVCCIALPPIAASEEAVAAELMNVELNPPDQGSTSLLLTHNTTGWSCAQWIIRALINVGERFSRIRPFSIFDLEKEHYREHFYNRICKAGDVVEQERCPSGSLKRGEFVIIPWKYVWLGTRLLDAR
ncbi:hypothetical protein EIP86_004240 [Pleurotus ostreatoroseus]|nr:hypothetical protein EIP86_004240 [Pleurotus ostreatoroseus]